MIIIIVRAVIIIFDIIFNIIVGCVFTIFSGRVSVGDSMRLLQLGAVMGRDAMTVDVEYHGGLGGIGIGSAMVIGVVNQECT